MTTETTLDENETPRTIIHLEADLGSSSFAVATENCDPVQLFGAGKLLELLGMEGFADMRGQAIAANAAQAPRIITPRGHN